MSEEAKPEITPGPWELCVLDIPLVDVPEYVRQCIVASGGLDYHFVRAKNANGEWVDVCHVGNGPMGNFNGHYIAQLPALLDEITALRAALDQEREKVSNLEAERDLFRRETVALAKDAIAMKDALDHIGDCPSGFPHYCANCDRSFSGNPTALLSGRGEAENNG